MVRICVGSEPALSGSVREKLDVRSPASSGQSQRSFCSSLAPTASSSPLPESGAWLPKTLGADGVRPRISCMSARRSWPIP